MKFYRNKEEIKLQDPLRGDIFIEQGSLWELQTHKLGCNLVLVDDDFHYAVNFFEYKGNFEEVTEVAGSLS